MNTKIVLTASSILMGITGLLLTFLPQEVATTAGWNEQTSIVLQIIGALYFGFAMINWMSKANLIGGIYNRPLAVGNLTHFVIAALACVKYSPKNTTLIIVTIIYSIFAIAFGYILFTHPVRETKAN